MKKYIEHNEKGDENGPRLRVAGSHHDTRETPSTAKNLQQFPRFCYSPMKNQDAPPVPGSGYSGKTLSDFDLFWLILTGNCFLPLDSRK